MNIIFTPMMNYDLEEEIMGCLKLLKDERKGKIITMPKKKQEDKKQNVIQISVGGVITIVITIALAAISASWIISGSITSLNKDVKSINTKLNTANSEIKEMKEYLYADGGVKDQLGELSNNMDSITELLNITAIKANVTTEEYINSNVSVVDNNVSNSTSSFSADTCIGTDSEGKAYIAKDLIGQTILLTFDQGDKETYFLGQYNDKYHWDGYCVINTYTDGVLNGVSESNFDDGNRLNYESFYLSDNQGEWIYTDRDCKEDSNDGISIRYKLDYDKQKNFTLTNARASDIIYVENLTSYDNKEVLSYYVGSTSDGVYNDNSGDAYLVRYNEDGFVNVFYKGCFQNGSFDDTNAVEIVFDSSNDRYFLYQGTFVDGKRTSDDGIEYVTQNEIDTILKENECPNDLKWYFD